MDINDLKLFARAAELGNITHAAAEIVANFIDCSESYAFCLAAAQDGEICLGYTDERAQLL